MLNKLKDSESPPTPNTLKKAFGTASFRSVVQRALANAKAIREEPDRLSEDDIQSRFDNMIGDIKKAARKKTATMEEKMLAR